MTSKQIQYHRHDQIVLIFPKGHYSNQKKISFFEVFKRPISNNLMGIFTDRSVRFAIAKHSIMVINGHFFNGHTLNGFFVVGINMVNQRS